MATEIILMDKDFSRLCVIRDFTSLRWRESYYGDGSFELCLPVKYLESAIRAAYVFRKDKTETGLISRFIKSSGEIVIKGAFLGSRLKTRVLNSAFSFSGKAEDAARELVRSFCINDSARRIDRLALGAAPALGKNVSVQFSGVSVYDALRELLTEQEASFSLRYDIYGGGLYFDIIKGLDRTTEQAENTWCVFSGDYYNVLSETYERAEDYRNFAYVVSGAPDGVSPAVVTVDLIKSGEERREIYVEAKDIWKGGDISGADLNALLYERGLQKLAEHNEGECVECSVDMSKMGNMAFSLGDKCEYSNTELGIAASGRVTEIEEVFESNEISISVVLGKEQLGLVKRIKRGI